MDKKLLDALAAKAEQRKADKTKAKQFEVGGRTARSLLSSSMTAQLDAYAEAFLSEACGKDTVRSIAAQVIYDCCPALQEPELHTALGITDPYDTVWALMRVRRG
ncbi:MAG: hypothetical protein V8Q23_06320 [Eubacteriales bacterium]